MKFALTSQDHRISYEKNILGQIMLKSELIETASDLVGPADFQDEKFRHIYSAMIDAYSDGKKSLGMIDVAPYLQKKGIFDFIGLELLEDIENHSATSVDFDHNLAKIQSNARRRKLLSLLVDYTMHAEKANDDVEDVIEGLIADAASIGSDKLDGLSFISEKILPKLKQEAEAAMKGDKDLGISPGLPSLERSLSGFEKSRLYILASRPGMGKSALGLNFALSAAKEGKTVLFISLEMSNDEIGRRAIANLSGITPQRQQSGMSPNEVDSYVEANRRLGELRLVTRDEAQSIKSIRALTRRMQKRRDYGIDLLVVDYLQLIQPGRKNPTREQEVSEMSRGLKALAMEFKIPVIALSQLNRNVEHRNDHKPKLSDLRDSGSIEQDADVVMLLYRDAYYNPDGDDARSVEISVAKNRNGAVGKTKVGCTIEHGQFYDL